MASASASEIASALVDLHGTAIEVDDAISDEGYAESTSTSYVTSIASSIRRGVEENGRLYANYGQPLSALPIDDHEVSRGGCLDNVYIAQFSTLTSCESVSHCLDGSKRPPTRQILPTPKPHAPPLTDTQTQLPHPRPRHRQRHLGNGHCRPTARIA